ncbi:putative methyl-accepting chemotaxis sensory transducer [Mycobacteroides abscessus subsp. massiliense]|uniref:hypothetical protein n=1 Tax=Mycobacteroides abscessus TaxID=36809 RepID=UPI0009A68911|nr:hypothetical protein [Mycobacteroides abscessus]SKF37389.1 putative methyl-accepting chemotaxis sensory transducer [Mycobacteroides abscessus subsp. massiliense]SKF42915.1 putative methyl-accepting chemotaxis sensory transducer [Mycobacteroides abscessus subsp. massiliense]SKF44411.1 putative methyl-accepting chemotaxis sensory transducer [Mycobacteroides abscessus subsp. massiliense]SKF47552.1 putative methyl-accepting chemotaxis sensory transducer [Mycobacteroides abscessus subsp. massilie
MPSALPAGGVEAAVIGDKYPQNPAAVDAIREFYEARSAHYAAIAEGTLGDMGQQAELLQGAAGDANQEALLRQANAAHEISQNYKSRAQVAGTYADTLRWLQNRLTDIAQAARHDYDECMKAKQPGMAQEVIARYRLEAEEAAAQAAQEITTTKPRITTPELGSPAANPAHPSIGRAAGNNDGTHMLDETTKKNTPGQDSHGKQSSVADDAKPGAEKDAHSKDPADQSKQTDPDKAGADKTKADKALGDDNFAHQKQTGVPADPSQVPNQPAASPLTGLPMNGMPQAPGGASGGGNPGLGNAAGMGSLSGMTHGSALQSGLGGAKPPSTPSFGGGSTPTSPASSVASQSSFGEGLRSATSGFNSGLASGMGSTGAAPAQQVAQPYQGQQPGLTTSAQPTPAPQTASASAAPPPSAPPTGGGMSGGGFMPPMAAGAAGSGTGVPLAPYSTPHGAPAPSGGTTPASTTPSSTPSSSSQSSGSAVSAAGSPILGAGHTTTTQTPRPVNQDLILAQQIITELVRADPASPIEWAVSILRSQVGTHIFVASNVAGGIYLPRNVFLPTTVKLAALDPALPIGWYSKWIGWPNPMEILADHYHRTLATIRGVRCSAMATSRPLSRPVDAGIPWAFINRLELPPGSAATLDAAHQHRLTATDASLAARIAGMDPSQHTPLAVVITQQVLGQNGMPGAAESDARDSAILDKVSKGAVTEEDWQTYLEEAYQADLEPALHAPLSTDDSDITMREKANYKAFYMSARVKELVSCWAQLPPSIFDIAYTALCAGLNVNATVETFTEAQYKQPVAAAAQ